MTPHALLRAARKLRLRGHTNEALQVLALRDTESTEPDGVVLQDSLQAEQQEGLLYEDEVKQYLLWLGKQIQPTLHSLLYKIKDAVKRDSNTQFPNLVLRGITESMKAYGFHALEGKTLPYAMFQKTVLPRNMPPLPHGRRASLREARKLRLADKSKIRPDQQSVYDGLLPFDAPMKKMGFQLGARSLGRICIRYHGLDLGLFLADGDSTWSVENAHVHSELTKPGFSKLSQEVRDAYVKADRELNSIAYLAAKTGIDPEAVMQLLSKIAPRMKAIAESLPDLPEVSEDR